MRKSCGLRQRRLAFCGFIAPAVILFTVFFFAPLVLSILLSLTNFDGWKQLDFIGLKNYTKLFSDKKFFTALERTLGYTGLSLPLKVIVPLILAALLVNRNVKLLSVSRTFIYIPVLLSSLVVGLIINWFFSQEYGLVNYMLTGIGLPAQEWATKPLARFVITFASNWSSTGFYMIIYIGALENVSTELKEAASIDGANSWQRFIKVILPEIAPTTFLVVLLCTINLLKEYSLVQGITQGGPGTYTTYVIQYIFDRGFNRFEYGYASAASVITSLVFALITFIQFKVSNGGDK